MENGKTMLNSNGDALMQINLSPRGHTLPVVRVIILGVCLDSIFISNRVHIHVCNGIYGQPNLLMRWSFLIKSLRLDIKEAFADASLFILRWTNIRIDYFVAKQFSCGWGWAKSTNIQIRPNWCHELIWKWLKLISLCRLEPKVGTRAFGCYLLYV